MTERFTGEVSQRGNDYRRHVHDYFFARPDNQEEREYYESRGLTFTNNLHLWFIEESEREVLPGFPNPYDYRARPFGEVIEGFRTEYPELWQEVRAVMSEKRVSNALYIALLQKADATQADYDAYERDQREYANALAERAATVKSQAFDIIAPRMAEAGLDPLDLCK
jgi:hypothetical protein